VVSRDSDGHLAGKRQHLFVRSTPYFIDGPCRRLHCRGKPHVARNWFLTMVSRWGEVIGLGIDHPPMGRSGQINQSTGTFTSTGVSTRGPEKQAPKSSPPPHLAGPHIVANPPNLAVPLTHCGLLILEKNSKFYATSCQI